METVDVKLPSELMKAVSNTTPPRYLIAIEQEHLLGQLDDFSNLSHVRPSK
jgi:hypothetical protein